MYMIDCRGVVQLEGLDPWYNPAGPAKVGACKSFLGSLLKLLGLVTQILKISTNFTLLTLNFRNYLMNA